MPTAPQPLAPIDPAATGGELVVAAAAALEPDGNAPVGSARTWRVACAGCGRRGYRLLERHAHGLVPASARRCACGSARFEPLARRAPVGPRRTPGQRRRPHAAGGARRRRQTPGAELRPAPGRRPLVGGQRAGPRHPRRLRARLAALSRLVRAPPPPLAARRRGHGRRLPGRPHPPAPLPDHHHPAAPDRHRPRPPAGRRG